MKRCLYCYRPLEADANDWHPACSKRFFGKRGAPVLDLDLGSIVQAGLRVVAGRTAVAGAQRKLSVDIAHVENQIGAGSTIRLSVNVGDRFILKPPTEEFPHLPELEDATMHLARTLRMSTAEHTLFRFRGGELGYLTRRFDRTDDGHKLPMEDFAQITGRLSEDKYKGSVEQVGRYLNAYSVSPELDMVRLFEIVLFAFIIGNSDMHLKNYSLLTGLASEEMPKGNTQNPGPRLSPAYDLVPVRLVLPQDMEESALTLSGKKSNLRRGDFVRAATTLGLSQAVIAASISFFTKKLARVEDFLATTFISPELQVKYAELVRERLKRLNEA